MGVWTANPATAAAALRAMNPKAHANSHAVLKEAIGGNRVIGVVMIGMGLLTCLPAMLERSAGEILNLYVLAVSGGFFALGPGILYQIAASGMKYHAFEAIPIQSVVPARVQPIESDLEK